MIEQVKQDLSKVCNAINRIDDALMHRSVETSHDYRDAIIKMARDIAEANDGNRIEFTTLGVRVIRADGSIVWEYVE